MNLFLQPNLQRVEEMKCHSTLSKDLRKSEDMTARGSLSVFERSVETQITENV